jgi:hypothetical protein
MNDHNNKYDICELMLIFILIKYSDIKMSKFKIVALLMSLKHIAYLFTFGITKSTSQLKPTINYFKI